MNNKRVIGFILIINLISSILGFAYEEGDGETVYNDHCANGKVKKNFIWHEEYVPANTVGMSLDKAKDRRERALRNMNGYIRGDFFRSKVFGRTNCLRYDVLFRPNDSVRFVGCTPEQIESYRDSNFIALTKEYVPRPPIEWIKKNVPTNDPSNFTPVFFGYNEKGDWDASNATQYHTFYYTTTIKEAPREDGHILYEIIWSPELYCKYGVRLKDNLSK